MILDALGNAARYDRLHPLFAAAFGADALGIADLPVGKHAIEGDRLLVIIGRDAVACAVSRVAPQVYRHSAHAGRQRGNWLAATSRVP